IREDAVVAHELNRYRPSPGFHLCAPTQVIKLHAPAAGGNLHPAGCAGQAHTAPAGISLHGAAHITKVEIAAGAAGAQVTIALAHLDASTACRDGRALGSSYVHPSTAERNPRLSANVVDMNIATPAAESEVRSEIAAFHVAAASGDLDRTTEVIQFDSTTTRRTQNLGGDGIQAKRTAAGFHLHQFKFSRHLHHELGVETVQVPVQQPAFDRIALACLDYGNPQLLELLTRRFFAAREGTF